MPVPHLASELSCSCTSDVEGIIQPEGSYLPHADFSLLYQPILITGYCDSGKALGFGPLQYGHASPSVQKSIHCIHNALYEG